MGRMVDADALKENFPLPCEEWEMKGQQTLWEAREIWETIDRMPTIEERKRGKWISNSPVTMRCNQCTYVASDWIVHEFHYCPNCGARMEEE